MTRAQLPEPIEKCKACGGEGICVTQTGMSKACRTCKGLGIVAAAWWDPSSPNRGCAEPSK